MSDNQTTQTPLPFLKAIWQQVTLVFGIITGIFAFVKAFQDEFDL